MKATINYQDRELEVEYDYFPPEPPVWYYSGGSGYPGAPEEYDIYSVKYKGREIIRLLSRCDINELKELLSEL